MSLLVVLSNWKRPLNLPTLIESIHRGSLTPDRLIIVDNHPMQQTEFALPQRVRKQEEVYSIPNNLGPAGRWLAAVLSQLAFGP